MWKSAYVGVYQLLNWKMHGETLKIKFHDFMKIPLTGAEMFQEARGTDRHNLANSRFSQWWDGGE